MAKFVFKLDSMKRFRENRLLVAKKDYARIEAQLEELKSKLYSVEQQRKEAISQSVSDLEAFAVAQLNATLIHGQNIRKDLICKDIKRVEEELERQRRWVAQLGQELRVVEKLEEKQRTAFEDMQKMYERKMMDRWVAERWKGEDR